MQDLVAATCKFANQCGNCSRVRDMSMPGFRVFTFKNPYLGNYCVPFQHWACCRECAVAIEEPARREEVRT